MTTPDQLRAIAEYLEDRVKLANAKEKDIVFEPPTVAEITAAGLDESTFKRMTSTSWWPEMVDDIIETPDFAEPDATPAVILGYAKDVIREYIGKNFDIGP